MVASTINLLLETLFLKESTLERGCFPLNTLLGLTPLPIQKPRPYLLVQANDCHVNLRIRMHPMDSVVRRNDYHTVLKSVNITKNSTAAWVHTLWLVKRRVRS